jgi:ABC-type multidrug transport system fused ATPase/permease subunit
MLAPIELTRALITGTTRVLYAAIVAVRVAERLVLAGAAVLLGARGVASASLATGVLLLLVATRTMARLLVLGRLRERVYTLAIEGLLRRDLLVASSHDREGEEGTLFEALYSSEQVVANLVLALIADIVAAIVISVVVAPQLPTRLVLSTALGVLVAGVLAELLRRVAQRASKAGWEAFRPVGEGVHAALNGALDLVANGRETHHVATVARATRAWVASARSADVVGGFAGRIPLAIGLATVISAVAYDEYSQLGSATRAMSDAVVALSLLPAFAGVVQGGVALTRMIDPSAQLLALVQSAQREEPAESALPQLPATVRWSHVSFAYAGHDGGPRVEALRECSVVWPKGSLLAIAGPNGAGKSTLLRLLLGLARPDAGQISIGDAPLSSIDVGAFRRHVAYLPQKPYLPEHKSVRASFATHIDEASDELITRCLQRVELLSRLEKKRPTAPLDVTIADLSWGERQRVALARALAQPTEYLLVDEPDASLDVTGVALVGRLLREESRTRMVAVIAHTRALVDIADVIVELQSPEPSSAGPREPSPPGPLSPGRGGIHV